MLVLVLCLLAIASPMLFGGRMSRLALVGFRGWWILAIALIAQIVIIEVVPGANRVLLEGIHMATYVAAGIFVALNWRVPGLLIIALGGAANGITIALNGGQLPASREALRMAGIHVAKGDFINSGVIKDPVLPLLGDYFVWPQPFPFANVFSVGDVLIVLGTLYGAHKITGSRLVKRPWRLSEELEAALSAAQGQEQGREQGQEQHQKQGQEQAEPAASPAAAPGPDATVGPAAGPAGAGGPRETLLEQLVRRRQEQARTQHA